MKRLGPVVSKLNHIASHCLSSYCLKIAYPLPSFGPMTISEQFKIEPKAESGGGLPDGESKAISELSAYFETVAWDQPGPSGLWGLQRLRTEVIGQRNLGDHIISIFPEKSQLHQAQLFFICPPPHETCFLEAIDELVNTEPPLKRHLTLAPNASTDEFWLGLGSFDYTPEGKNGCRRL